MNYAHLGAFTSLIPDKAFLYFTFFTSKECFIYIVSFSYLFYISINIINIINQMAEVSTIKIPDIPREKKDKYNLFLISKNT